jgi:hypothetical protein
MILIDADDDSEWDQATESGFEEANEDTLKESESSEEESILKKAKNPVPIKQAELPKPVPIPMTNINNNNNTVKAPGTPNYAILGEKDTKVTKPPSTPISLTAGRDIELLKKRVEELEKERNLLDQQKKDAENSAKQQIGITKSKYEKEVETLRRENEDLQALVEEKEKLIVELQSRSPSASSEKTQQLQKDNTFLQSQLSASKKEAEGLRIQLREKEYASMAVLRTEVDPVPRRRSLDINNARKETPKKGGFLSKFGKKDKKEKLETDLAELEKENEELFQENEQLQNRLKAMAMAPKSLINVDALTKECADLRKQLVENTNRMQDQTSKISELEEDLSRSTKEEAKLEKELVNIKLELAELKTHHDLPVSPSKSDGSLRKLEESHSVQMKALLDETNLIVEQRSKLETENDALKKKIERLKSNGGGQSRSPVSQEDIERISEECEHVKQSLEGIRKGAVGLKKNIGLIFQMLWKGMEIAIGKQDKKVLTAMKNYQKLFSHTKKLQLKAARGNFGSIQIIARILSTGRDSVFTFKDEAGKKKLSFKRGKKDFNFDQFLSSGVTEQETVQSFSSYFDCALDGISTTFMSMGGIASARSQTSLMEASNGFISAAGSHLLSSFSEKEEWKYILSANYFGVSSNGVRDLLQPSRRQTEYISVFSCDNLTL